MDRFHRKFAFLNKSTFLMLWLLAKITDSISRKMSEKKFQFSSSLNISSKEKLTLAISPDKSLYRFCLWILFKIKLIKTKMIWNGSPNFKMELSKCCLNSWFKKSKRKFSIVLEILILFGFTMSILDFLMSAPMVFTNCSAFIRFTTSVGGTLGTGETATVDYNKKWELQIRNTILKYC